MKNLLSATFGVPLALVTMVLLFAVDSRQVARARRSPVLLAGALLGFVAVLVLLVSRFAEYA